MSKQKWIETERCWRCSGDGWHVVNRGTHREQFDCIHCNGTGRVKVERPRQQGTAQAKTTEQNSQGFTSTFVPSACRAEYEKEAPEARALYKGVP